jgi:hypothetical protein
MRATFLGHQGWIVQTDRAAILIDPLLDEHFGQFPEAGLRVYPPRRIDFGQLPPIDAVFISHEHDDHLQLATLARISREVPVFLSDRSSWAAQRILEDMEFSVERVSDGTTVETGDLRLTAFGADLTQGEGFHDEWDVMTYGLSCSGRPGAFYSSVDVVRPSSATRWLESHGPTVVTFTNNLTTLHPFRSWAAPPAGALSLVGEIAHWFSDGTPAEKRPRLVLAVGGGWSYSGAKAWMNRRCFPADNHLIEAALRAAGVADTVPFRAVRPGDTVVFAADGPPELRTDACPYLACGAPQDWPDRRFDDAPGKVGDLQPLTDGAPLGSQALDRLDQRLGELARDLVGSRFFCGLMSLTRDELLGKRPQYALSLGARDGQDLVYEYAPSLGVFRRTERDAQLYAAGGGCWASDLLALLDGRVNAAAFTFGHFFEWVNCKTAKPHLLALSDQLWKSVHPLRRPQQFYEAYRRRLGALADTEVLVFGPDRPTALSVAGGAR